MTQIAVVNCGMGNLHSALAGVKRAAPNVTATLTSTADEIHQADKIIFPGDGHFGACMQQIDRLQLRDALIEAAQTKPFLGICVGMQVLFANSEEAPNVNGLGIFSDTIRRFAVSPSYKVPHMGWNTVEQHQAGPITDTIAKNQRFYFIHSYYAPIGDSTLIKTNYQTDFSAIVGKNKLIATQFHPEKSGLGGIALLRQFITQNYD